MRNLPPKRTTKGKKQRDIRRTRYREARRTRRAEELLRINASKAEQLVMSC